MQVKQMTEQEVESTIWQLVMALGKDNALDILIDAYDNEQERAS